MSGLKKTVSILICAILFNAIMYAQKTWKVWSAEYSIANKTGLSTDDAFNAITLMSISQSPINGLLITENYDTFPITRDPHITDRNQSNLLFFDIPIHHFRIISPQISEGIICYFQSDKMHIKLPAVKSFTDSCDLPYIVPQSIWRQGLPDPTPGRTRTPTQHCIIHHSASANSDTNTIALVRAFYLHHTQVNHWDDIGYNYLIGHDGTLVAGRDPLDSGIAQDEVLGAHFCGKNSYTMGVCVIGNFQLEPPTWAAIHTLERLLTWKTHKDGLDPLDSMMHKDILLPVIAGHRDGCSTACPGDSLYAMIPQIRQDVSERLLTCPPLYNNSDITWEIRVWPNPANREVNFSGITDIRAAHLVSIFGKMFTCSVKENKILIPSDVMDGIYVLLINIKDKAAPHAALIQIIH